MDDDVLQFILNLKKINLFYKPVYKNYFIELCSTIYIVEF